MAKRSKALENADRVILYSLTEVRHHESGRILHAVGDPVTVFAVDARELLRGGNYVGSKAELAKVLEKRAKGGQAPPPTAPTKPEPRHGENQQPGGPGESNPTKPQLSDSDIGREIVGKIEQAGLGDFDKLRNATLDQLTAIPGIGTNTARKILAWVEEKVSAEQLKGGDDKTEDENEDE